MPGSALPSQDLDRVASALAATLPVLQRAIERRVDLESPHVKPPEGQLALLRFVARYEGTTVREAAQALLMKPNNVSALISQLTGRGLLERRQDDADKRIVRLHLTPTARRELAEVRRIENAHLTRAIRALTEGEMDALGSAVGALTSLTRHLHSAGA